MNEVRVALLLLLGLAVTACRETVVNGWPHFVIEGIVTSADGAAVAAGTSVQVDIWQGECVTGLPYQTATTTTGAAGAWSVTVTMPEGSLVGCARVTVGAASASRSFAAAPDDRLRIDVQLPAAGAATVAVTASGAPGGAIPAPQCDAAGSRRRTAPRERPVGPHVRPTLPAAVIAR